MKTSGKGFERDCMSTEAIITLLLLLGTMKIYLVGLINCPRSIVMEKASGEYREGSVRRISRVYAFTMQHPLLLRPQEKFKVFLDENRLIYYSALWWNYPRCPSFLCVDYFPDAITIVECLEEKHVLAT